jgi:hypothetical protein
MPTTFHRVPTMSVPLRLLALATCAALLRPAPLSAQTRWREIGRTSVGNPVYVDPKSVMRANGIVTATLRAEFVKPVRTPRGAITSSRTVAMLDCARRVIAVRENTYYHDERANKIYEHRVVGQPGYGPAIGGSLPDVALRQLCAK